MENYVTNKKGTAIETNGEASILGHTVRTDKPADYKFLGVV